MNLGACRPCNAASTLATRQSLHSGPASALASTSYLGLQQCCVDTSRLKSNSQASSSAKAAAIKTWQRRTLHTECALQSVPFKASKLTVQRFPGTLQSGPYPQYPRRYTLTHNDLTGQLLLTIGHQYNQKQLSGWYNRLLRDEILAYWQFSGDTPILHIECHVSGEETWLAPPILRDYIFRREMPLVLNVIKFAEAALLADNPAMANAQIMVHLASHVQAYHVSVMWGRLSDCSSWRPPPRWSRLNNTATQTAAAAPSLASPVQPTNLRDVAQQSAASAAACESLLDQPCVLPSADQSSMHGSSAESAQAESVRRRCQQQLDRHDIASLAEDAGGDNDTPSVSRPASETTLPILWRSKQMSAVYRLHAASAAVSAVSGHAYGHTGSSVSVGHDCKPFGLSYHVPPRLCKS